MTFRTMIFRIAVLCTVVMFGCSTAVFGQRSYPMLMSLSPVAAQTGQTGEHTVESRYSMFGVTQILISGEGVVGEVLTPMELGKDGKEAALTQVRLKLTVADDAKPGVRDFRLVGPTGPSTVGQLVITSTAVIAESRSNDTRETAEPIQVPCTVCGSIEKAEDVDFYQFTLEQPATLTFHCLAMRLQDKIHDLQSHVDPIITIRSVVTGSTLAAADNNFAADPLLTHSFEPGEYLLEVRDVRYQGNKYWNYSIEISDRPFVSNVHPTVVMRGQSTRLQLIGTQLSAESEVEYTAPDEMETCTIEVSLKLPDGNGDSNPVAIVVTDLAVVIETDAENNTTETAQQVSWPIAISGRIDAEADVDCYAIECSKGDQLCVEVLARRNGSALDSIIRILNDQGQSLAENDDLRMWGKRTVQDSRIDSWTAPADGRYVIEIRDVHLRGGLDSVYCLKITRAEPDFELFLDTDKTWLTPGTCGAVFVRAVRLNGFSGEIQLHVEGLPDGVMAHCGRIPPAPAIDGCVVLQADPSAEMIASNLRVRGTSTEAIVVYAQPMQEIYMPGGGRNHWPVEMHTVAVGTPSDILDVKLSTYDVVMKPGESVRMDVEIVRNEGFDKNVTLDMLFQHLSSKFADTLPAGVTIDARKSQTLLTGSNSKGSITLTCAGNAAPVVRQQCCIMANVSINFVMKATYSSPPLLITVLQPDVINEAQSK